MISIKPPHRIAETSASTVKSRAFHSLMDAQACFSKLCFLVSPECQGSQQRGIGKRRVVFPVASTWRDITECGARMPAKLGARSRGCRRCHGSVSSVRPSAKFRQVLASVVACCSVLVACWVSCLTGCPSRPRQRKFWSASLVKRTAYSSCSYGHHEHHQKQRLASAHSTKSNMFKPVLGPSAMCSVNVF